MEGNMLYLKSTDLNVSLNKLQKLKQITSLSFSFFTFQMDTDLYLAGN